MFVAIFETLLALAALAFFIPGIILLIIGIVRKRKGLWITGTVILS
jgi:hypothetical protein